jgi:hypothetical protein
MSSSSKNNTGMVKRVVKGKSTSYKVCGVCEERKHSTEYKKWRWRNGNADLCVCDPCAKTFTFPLKAKQARAKGNAAFMHKWVMDSKKKLGLSLPPRFGIGHVNIENKGHDRAPVVDSKDVDNNYDDGDDDDNLDASEGYENGEQMVILAGKKRKLDEELTKLFARYK